MTVVTYRVTLQEPTIVTALDGEPNSSVSFSYLPGSVLRGVIIGAYMRYFNLPSIDAADKTIQDLFFSSKTRFLNGYPVETRTNQRALPAPATWNRAKATNYPIYDSLITSVDESKSVTGFWAINGSTAYAAEPKRILNVHNSRDRRSGRPLGSDRGTVFRYDALAADQTFEAGLILDDDTSAQILYKVLASAASVLVGGSGSGGYGRSIIHDVSIPDEWHEAQSQPSKRLIITLLSDTVLRDTYGQYVTTREALCDALRPFLGETVSVMDDRAFMGVNLHGGFNRKWGLPQPQMPAIAMGSVIELTNYTRTDLLSIMLKEGIGERRNEGFGRIAVNWQPHAELTAPSDSEIPVKSSAREMSELSQKLWDRTYARIVQSWVDNEVLRITYRKRYRIQGPITRTQIMRLRMIIKNELRKGDDASLNCFEEFLKDIEGKAADKQMAQTTIGSKDLRTWLRAPEFRELRESNMSVPVILTLVDAVLEHAVKTRTQLLSEASHD